mmetsp:Transcript_146110/g.364339  ORF Transcript_146110/g.364339 Transcript_146110/m.364339 type:complete len:84 (-) Transcript_146110:1570-1821(-)
MTEFILELSLLGFLLKVVFGDRLRMLESVPRLWFLPSIVTGFPQLKRWLPVSPLATPAMSGSQDAGGKDLPRGFVESAKRKVS